MTLQDYKNLLKNILEKEDLDKISQYFFNTMQFENGGSSFNLDSNSLIILNISKIKSDLDFDEIFQHEFSHLFRNLIKNKYNINFDELTEKEKFLIHQFNLDYVFMDEIQFYNWICNSCNFIQNYLPQQIKSLLKNFSKCSVTDFYKTRAIILKNNNISAYFLQNFIFMYIMMNIHGNLKKQFIQALFKQMNFKIN